MRLALLQINPTVGDLEGNARKIIAGAARAKAQAADLIVPTEMALLGYPPRDLVLQKAFVDRARRRLEEMARELGDGPPVLVGLAEENPSAEGRPLFNSAALLQEGRVGPFFRKTLLPTYDVFDEDRYFEPAQGPQILELQGRRLGISICEDVWNDRSFWQKRRYHRDPIEELIEAGAEAIINLSASPFRAGKYAFRERMLSALAARHGRPVALVNQVGGNDDLIFDGRSALFDAAGKLVARARAFEEDLLVVELDPPGGRISEDDYSPESEIWRGLVLGLRDYAAKCGFSRVLLGLSGGIDSSLTAAVAAEALGGDKVLGVLMPSPYSSPGSVEDSLTLAANLGLKTLTLPIGQIMAAFDQTLSQPFKGLQPDVTEENVQARIRGNLLMSLSNKLGGLLLTTGNKSELAVGYCTLYGDMCGGLAVIADVPKTMVYRLCRWLNQTRGREVIPEPVLAKPPSAELRPDQKDQDSLPSYDLLDRILKLHVEEHLAPEEIAAQGLDQATVDWVVGMVRTAEFKRRQAAPGLKVTDRAFGSGWRMPIARK